MQTRVSGLSGRVSGLSGRVLSCALTCFTVMGGAASVASAQTTVTLNQPTSQVVFATLRGGSHANKNDQSLLATRASDDPEYKRRAMLKFDTEHGVPAGSAVTSAILTVTVKTGSDDASRKIAIYQVTTSWSEAEVTWNNRRKKEKWMSAGGDLGSKLAEATVSNVAGSKVSFDVTPLVKMAVAGDLGSSRYSRLVLVDTEGSTSESYREFVTPTDSNSASRPTLKVAYGTAAQSGGGSSTSGTGTTLRVLHWNTHHGGVGTDGVYSPDRLVKKAASFKPDVVSFNEVEHYGIDQPAGFAALMKKYTGVTWYYKYTSGTGSQSGIGNLIMSRIPFDATDIQALSYTRAAVDATIHVNGRIINVTSTHLDDASTSYRLKEIGELTAWARTLAEQRILCGDFNAWPGTTENATMKATYYDSWAEAQADGTAVAYPGNTAGNTRNSRIDYIYYSKTAAYLTLKSSQVFDVRDANGVMPSDHRPILSIFTVK